ncbi:hypothetical protein LWI29_010079 [Acer saccharum]|uniref:MSP domain-containing protein n=1 Tax=Acer saccharum TaxID=4024 RepID=A0AA39SVN6_ACESA|nr:hypothetical protein LWI29_010079 [Acer saccharum]
MAIADRQKSSSDMKLFSLCPFWQSTTTTTTTHHHHLLLLLLHTKPQQSRQQQPIRRRSNSRPVAKTVSSVARSLLPPRRRLRLDPANTLYFPYEPGKQVRSAIRLKNTSRSM